jgi:hypothetical protein
MGTEPLDIFQDLRDSIDRHELLCRINLIAECLADEYA